MRVDMFTTSFYRTSRYKSCQGPAEKTIKFSEAATNHPSTHSRRDNALQQAVEPKATEKLAHEVEDTRKEHSHTGDDLCQGLSKSIEERAEVLLGFRESIELSFGPLDSAADFFQHLRGN